MEIKTVEVRIERKFNLGNYESVSCSVALWAGLDPEEGQ